MRRKDITENPFKKFQQNIAKGFNATQKGGALAPDALEKGIKSFFTNVDDDDKEKKSSKGSGKTPTDNTTKGDVDKAVGDGKGALATMAAKRKYSKELKGYTNAKADSNPPEEARLVGNDGKLYHWSGSMWLVRNDIDGRYVPVKDQEAVKAGWIDAAAKGKRTYIKKESTMNKKAIGEGLADLAGRAEADHEVQMARADLYKIAKYAIKLHDMLKDVSEERGMEGWQQAKITKAADYIGSVYHNLDYDLKFGDQNDEIGPDAEMQMGESRDTHCSDKCCGSDVKREDCKCPPDCKHCNCNATNVDEGKYKNDAQRKAVHAAKNEKKKTNESTDPYKARIAEKLNKKLTGK